EYPLNKIKNKHAQKQGKLKLTLKFFASLRAILKNKIDRYFHLLTPCKLAQHGVSKSRTGTL
ncbi:MAG: hypothetical protein LBQ50_11435, partial [Planctomycetaceae bacterium]|nr:hypothetical protein [Planctomycetaceae bacterium]